MYPDFPLLTPDQIECKVNQVNKAGVALLLYKTSRTDMDLLDSVVGSMNWTKTYRDIDGVLYCSVGIRNPENGEWVYKEDCGIESRADGKGNEKKGEASDAFKRAGFCWGIGRELYSSPAIFARVPTKQNGNSYEMENRYTTFSVEHIAYDENRKISELIIVTDKGDIAFKFPSTVKKPAPKASEPKAERSCENLEPAKAKDKAPVITGSVEDNTAPWEEPENGEISQEALTSLIQEYIRNKNTDEKRKLGQIIKKMNDGKASYKDVPNPEARKQLYEYFQNLKNSA